MAILISSILHHGNFPKLDRLNLGIIGMSSGNGHPYSWSAIFNGYEPSVMAECGFPTISSYLKQQSFPKDCIPGARITQIWTQDRALSRHIADATFINTIAENPEDMIGQVDAVLLARDDAENHSKFAEPFINAGLPIYIDKPFSHSYQAAMDFFALEKRPAQIFSCSALKFAQEMLLSPQDIKSIGGINHISAQVPRSWKKYAIHVIDPILQNCTPLGAIRDIQVHRCGSNNDETELHFNWGNKNKTCKIKALGDNPSPILVNYIGSNGVITTQFSDSFSAFKSALSVFLEDSVRGQKSHFVDIIAAIKLLELGI